MKKIRIISQPQKYIKAGGGPVNASPPVLQRFFIVPKSWTKNRFLVPGPGLRAANLVNLRFASPGPGHQVSNLLCVRLLERFRFHDETSVKGRDFFSTVNLSTVELYLSIHLLFLIYFLDKRVKKPLVLETLETNEVYLQRHRWFLHLRTSPKKKFSLPVVKSPVPFFSSRSSFFIIVAVSPSEVCIGGRPIPAVAHFFLLQSLNFAWWGPGVINDNSDALFQFRI